MDLIITCSCKSVWRLGGGDVEGDLSLVEVKYVPFMRGGGGEEKIQVVRRLEWEVGIF